MAILLGSVLLAARPLLAVGPALSWRTTTPIVSCTGPTDNAGRSWFAPAFDDGSWMSVSLPTHNTVPGGNDGFYRGMFTGDGYATAIISFDTDDGVWIYVNGTFKGHWGRNCHQSGCVGQTGGCSGTRVFLDITSELVLGTNVIGMHVSNSAAAGSYASLYFTSYTVTSPPLDLLQPPQDAFCPPTCLFDWVPSASAVSKYVLFTDGAVRKDNIPPSVTQYALTVAEELFDGPHTWTVQGCDGTGSCISSPNTFTVNVDAVPPAPFELTEPPDGAWRSRLKPFTFRWSPTSDGASLTPSGLDHYEVSIDGHPPANVSTAETSLPSSNSAVLPLLTDGDHSWQVTAVDKVGNRMTTTARTVRVDSALPVFPSFDPDPPDFSWTTDTMPTVHWSLPTDSASGIAQQYVRLDGTQFDIGMTETRLSVPAPLGNGLHFWFVTAVDHAGNEAQTTPFRFGVDTVGPSGLRLNGASPGTADGGVVSSLTPTLCWMGAMDAGVGLSEYRLYLNGAFARSAISSSASCTTPPQGVSDGVYEWHVDALDALGNVSHSLETFTFTVETQPPESFVLQMPANGASLAESRPTFSWTASVDRGIGLDRYEVSVDSGEDGVCSTSCIVPASQTNFVPNQDLTVGPHSWFVTAVDKAGKRTQAGPQSFSVLPTPTATVTATRTATLTPTQTATSTQNATATTSPTATRTRTVTPSPTQTRPATATATSAANLTATATVTASVTPTATVVPTTATPTPSRTPAPSMTPVRCAGDCDGSEVVAINELVLLVNIALGSSPMSQCESADLNADGLVSIDEVIRAVNHALEGCTS